MSDFSFFVSARAHFVVGCDSYWIHATGSYLTRYAGEGWVRCLCGTDIKIAPDPPERFIGGWHDYCGECAALFHTFADVFRKNVTTPYPSWLREAAFGVPSSALTDLEGGNGIESMNAG